MFVNVLNHAILDLVVKMSERSSVYPPVTIVCRGHTFSPLVVNEGGHSINDPSICLSTFLSSVFMLSVALIQTEHILLTQLYSTCVKCMS